MPLVTRKPTAKPSWPALLIAGAEKAGKSWTCAVASASPKIGRTLWVSIGETDPDAYGAIPGANFEIVYHDGTVKGIVNTLTEIANEPQGELPTLLVVDSMTRLWDMVTDDLQNIANNRERNRGQISMDLWNKGKKDWQRAVKAILAHKGPALLTARLEPVTVMDERGRPTPIKADKIKTEKSLPYDVDGVVQMPERGVAIISGIRSTVLQLQEPTQYPGFTVDGLWDSLGLADVAPRQVSHPVPEEAPVDPVEPVQAPQEPQTIRRAQGGAR